VAVSAFWTERDDHMGPNAPDVPCNGPYCSRGIHLVNSSVGVAQYGNISDTQHGCGGSQFHFANAADFGRFGRFAL
jgi:hypothetical protein